MVETRTSTDVDGPAPPVEVGDAAGAGAGPSASPGSSPNAKNQTSGSGSGLLGPEATTVTSNGSGSADVAAVLPATTTETQSRDASAPANVSAPISVGSAGPPGSSASTTSTVQVLRPESSTYLLTDPKLKEILLSDVGIESLLTRLKQSVHTCKEFAGFIKRLATIESEHSAHIKKVSRMVSETFKKPDVRKGTFQTQILNIIKTTDRVGDAGSTYIDSMHRIHDELMELVKNIERQRKATKETALRHEKNLLDAESLADKAKSKYDTTCDELERARTGDPSKNKLGFKPKSEEDLHRRMTIAEVDYQQKVDTVQRMRKELVAKHRDESARKLQNLILECDQALSLQVLRSSNLSETLELNRGFAISPIKPKNSPTANLTLKEMACKIDNELDFYNFVYNIPKQRPTLNRKPVTFRKHPTLGGGKTTNPPSNNVTSTAPPPWKSTTTSGNVPPPTSTGASSTPRMGGSSQFQSPSAGFVDTSANSRPRQTSNYSNGGGVIGGASAASIPSPSVMLGSGTAKTGPILSTSKMHQNSPPNVAGTQKSSQQAGSWTPSGPPAISSFSPPSAPQPAPAPAPVPAPAPAPSSAMQPPAITVTNSAGSEPTPVPPPGAGANGPRPDDYDPAKHGLAVYGTPLDELLEYEEGTVPRIVYQCVQAIDNFGLEVEGIYRTNGNSLQVQEIRREFDIDASNVDLLRPNEKVNDIHSVASALKQYFQALPDPLLTKEFHREFINAANIKDDIRRRDTIHAVINKLPDPNYTTLRYLIFHLYRVQEREVINRMGITNLSIVWGPTLMNTDYSNVGEMAVQSRVIETVLVNAYAIFEAE